MSLSFENSELLQRWNVSKKALDWHKEEEAKLRAQVGLNIFPSIKEGTKTIELGGGYRCSYTAKVNYTLSLPYVEGDSEISDLGAALEQMAEEMRLASNQGAFIFERLVKWKPSLSVSEYKKLPDNLRKIVDRYVTTSEGAPTLEIKEPAKGK